MTSSSDHQRNTRFRAPQFAMGRAADGDAAFGELTLDPSPERDSERPGAADGAAEAPKIIVRRRRQLELPVESSADDAQGDAESRRPRVFLLPRTDEGEGAAPAARPEDALVEAVAPGDPAPAAQGDPPAATAPHRRRATPDFRRAGPVTIARPLDEAARHGAPPDAPAPSLAELMQRFEELNAQLAAMLAKPRTRLDLDLTIHKRWSAVDAALQALRDSLPDPQFEMAF